MIKEMFPKIQKITKTLIQREKKGGFWGQKQYYSSVVNFFFFFFNMFTQEEGGKIRTSDFRFMRRGRFPTNWATP
jgi:hypothetical protein